MTRSSKSRQAFLRVEQMENRLVPSATDYVGGLYQKILHRTGSAGEVNYWSQQLQAGASGATVTHSIMQSDERHGMEINDLYQTDLGRAPDAGGLDYWKGVMRKGATHDDVERSILESPEFQSSHPDNHSFVSGVYDKVLGRPADAGGASYWENALSTGTSRDAMIRAFQLSPEHTGQHVDDAYSNDLGRTEDAGERNYWSSQLSSGKMSSDTMEEKILSSPECEGEYGFDDSGHH